MTARRKTFWVLYHPHIGRDGSAWRELFHTRKAARTAAKAALAKYTPNPRYGFPAVGQPVRVTMTFEKVMGRWRVKP